MQPWLPRERKRRTGASAREQARIGLAGTNVSAEKAQISQRIAVIRDYPFVYVVFAANSLWLEKPIDHGVLCYTIREKSPLLLTGESV